MKYLVNPNNPPGDGLYDDAIAAVMISSSEDQAWSEAPDPNAAPTTPTLTAEQIAAAEQAKATADAIAAAEKEKADAVAADEKAKADAAAGKTNTQGS